MTDRAILTEAEAAERIGVAPRTLRAIRRAGEIRYIRPTPRKIFYSVDDISEYLEKHRCQDEPPCPSTNTRKVASGNTTSSKTASGIMDRLAARPSGMPKGLRTIEGGKQS